MSRVERNFTPLSAINNEGAMEVPIWQRGSRYSTEISINLPLQDYVPQEEIGINLYALSRRARLGGLSSVHVKGGAGEVSSYSPSVVGLSGPDGAGIAGARGTVKKVDTSSSSRSTEDDFFHSEWADATIRINTSEIEQRMKEKKQQVRSPEGWSTEINQALQRDLLKQGSGQLMGGFQGIGMQLFTDTWMTVFNLGSSYPIAVLGLIIPSYQIAGTVGMRALYSILPQNSDSDFRWSVCVGVQLDRAGVLAAMTQKDKVLGTQSLVRPLSSKKS